MTSISGNESVRPDLQHRSFSGMLLPDGRLAARQKTVVLEIFAQLDRDATFDDLRHVRQIGGWSEICHVCRIEARLLEQRRNDRVLLRSRPWCSEALTISVTNGNKSSMTSRTRNVGTGSSEQDVLGNFMMIRRISVCVYDRNTAIDDGADAVMVGLGDWAAMTSSTLRLKNAAKPSAVWPEAPVTLRSRPRIEDSDRHNIADK